MRTCCLPIRVWFWCVRVWCVSLVRKRCVFFQVLLVPCLAAAALLHHHMNPPVYNQDPWQVLKTSSYFIETVAIIPQLYLDSALRHAQVLIPLPLLTGIFDLGFRI